MTTPRTCTARRDPGVVSGFVVSIMFGLVAAAGLVVDLGRVLATKERLGVVAVHAGRTGAQEITGIHEGRVRIDPRNGAAAAHEVLRSLGIDGSVVVNDRIITVSVRSTVPMAILGVIGIPARTVSVTRSVEVVTQ